MGNVFMRIVTVAFGSTRTERFLDKSGRREVVNERIKSFSGIQFLQMQRNQVMDDNVMVPIAHRSVIT